MNNTISGKTPDEIKKGLECCTFEYCYRTQNECPYRDYSLCVQNACADALAYIQRLERERDAAEERCIVADDCYADLYWETKRMEAAAPKWISVEEGLPIEDETVIVCGNDGCVYAAQYWGHGTWRRELIGCIRGDTDVTPTHWMYMPEPPKEEE